MILLNILVAAHHDQVQFKNIINQDPQFQNDNIFYDDEQTLDQTTLANIDILLGNNQELLSKILNLPQARLAWIQLLSTGIDYLPLKQIQQHHILLTTLKGLHAEPIAESVIGMILSHYRALNFASRQHNWQKLTADLQMLSNKQVVIFGTGHIGSRCAQLLQAFHAHTIGVNHNGHPASNFEKTVATKKLNSAIFQADIIINTMPLTPDTKNFFNTAFFSQLTNQPLFISIGRGLSTNTNDLIAALRQQQISSAALDVTDPEPLPSDNPLWQMENVLITPHIAGDFQEYPQQAIQLFQENLQQFRQNHTVNINLVDWNKGY